MKKNTKLAGRIRKALLVTILVLISAVVLIVELSVRSEVRRNTELSLNKANIAMKELLDARHEQIFSRLQRFVEDSRFPKLLKSSRKLTTAFLKRTELDLLKVIRLDGKVVADNIMPEARGKNVDESLVPLLTKVIENERVFTSLASDKHVYIVTGIPYFKKRELAGVILGGIQLTDSFAYKLEELSRSELTVFRLNDNAAEIIATVFTGEGRKNLTNDLQAIVPEIRKQDKDGAKKLLTLSLGNETVFAKFYPFPDLQNVYSIISSSKDKQLAFLRRMELILGLVFLLSIGGGSLFSQLLSKRLTRSVNSLVSDVEVVKGGNYDHRIEPQTEDEIGFLAENFDSLRESFRQAQRELADYAENLEEKVKERTRELVQAQKETTDIMNTVSEGLFLLHQDGNSLMIGGQHSAVLADILGISQPARENFLRICAETMAENKFENAKKYFDLMFKSDVAQSLVNQLNPLREVEYRKGENVKYLSFDFKRIMREDGSIAHLMGTVTDITRRVELARKLELTEQKNKSQMATLTAILGTDPTMLQEFLEEIRDDLATVNETLKSAGELKDDAERKRQLELVYRIIHTIKGNASILNLTSIAETGHAFEENLEEFMNKETVSGKDFLPLVMKLSDLQKNVDEVEELLKTISNYQTSLEAGTQEDLFITTLKKSAEKIASETEKQVQFDTENFHKDDIPAKYRRMVKNALVQFARNSVSHGIETPDQREAAGKSPVGTIRIETELTTSGQNPNQKVLKVRYQDDGAGLNIEKIRKKAIEKNLLGENEERAETEIAHFIFHPGFSTADTTTMSAGRGVGMDIVKSEIEKIGGTIEIDTEPQKFCAFTLVVPI